jgi:hypothetical protein
MNRTWLYQTVTNDVGLMAQLPGGVHASTALQKTPELKPFLMYRSLAHVPGYRGDGVNLTQQETFYLFVHDEPGDYLQIEGILNALRALFTNRKDTLAGVACCTWLEDSEDWRDEDMGTIMKASRIQVRYLS